MKPVNNLNITPNISKCDDVYEALINAHAGLSIEKSMKLNAKLILLLINQIGDEDIILEAIDKVENTAN